MARPILLNAGPRAAADLSPEAIEARRVARARGRDGGLTGAELIRAADRALKAAHNTQRVANARRVRGRVAGSRKKDDEADRQLVQAAVQIRVARACPLDRGYLHALPLDRVQECRAEVDRLFREQGSARLAMLTAAMITEQQARQRAERST